MVDESKYVYSERNSKDLVKNKLEKQPTEEIQKDTDQGKSCLSKKQRKILIILGAACIICAIIGIIIYFCIGRKTPPPSPEPTIISPNPPVTKKLETEFELNNKISEPYRVNVKQKYTEVTLTNGIKNNQFVGRDTNYEIFIINETNSSEETINYFNKTYTAAILISSECIDTKSDNCEPQQMIDLTKVTRRNLRALEEIPDLKDIPLPLCLFNMTDNDVITSMKCPETMPKNIRQNMILDLYFFRPPAIKRPDKKGNNVTIVKSMENGKNHINETNGGICDVSDPFSSFCTTEMNTTTDLDGNVLFYDEIAFTNITHDENNSYIKNKITNLKDETEKMKNVDIKAYGEALKALIDKVEPYLKYYEEFSVENFKELYKVSVRENSSWNDICINKVISKTSDKNFLNEYFL